MGDLVSNELDGVRAVVTGGASGIGAAVIASLQARGARAVALDVNEPTAEGVTGFRCDVTDDASVVAAVADAVALLGGLDVVVNNAGIGAQGTVADNEDAEWARVLDLNVTGMARVSRACLPHLRASDRAAIVNVSSIAATAGLPQRALYSASKGAVLSLTLAMAADHVREGIRVNAVAPGTVGTPWVQRLLSSAPDPAAELAALEARQPHGRLVAPEEIGDAVAFLVGPSSGSTAGTVLHVDGGMQGLRLRPA
ncbi:SDR family oxidoreductase [Nocardioides sp. GY 10127]|uniref:SDR family NAD(P)-dependent oxidoreductase n=1 Tax=Nocardioides sp. GY 10127 TaxID=2569762 RepID=UPI0010A94A86|nr:SDR family oxidoreductase [Nocardioides sp. GY 10127]TIC79342.1 SDR family oxidoreductase [Nocardioides sp. GY 10127]